MKGRYDSMLRLAVQALKPSSTRTARQFLVGIVRRASVAAAMTMGLRYCRRLCCAVGNATIGLRRCALTH
jgi:hypothetical protein